MRLALLVLWVVVTSGCTTVVRAATRSTAPMKTTCTKARSIFVGSRYTSAQREEGNRELIGRHLWWQVRILDVHKDYTAGATQWKLVLVAECADAEEGNPFQVEADFDTFDLATPAKRDDLLALRKGETVDLEGIFSGVEETMGIPRFDRVVIRGLDVRRVE